MQQLATKVNPSEQVIKVGSTGDSVRFLLTGDDSNGSVSVFEVLVPGGHKIPAPAHKNDAFEETIYGIEGVLTWTVDGTPVEVGPGQALCNPRGAVHRFDNYGTQDAKDLVWGPNRLLRSLLRRAVATSSTPIHYDVDATTCSAKGAAVLLGRILFVAIFVMSGPRHFSSQVVGHAASQGVPLASILVPRSGVLALAGGLSIQLG